MSVSRTFASPSMTESELMAEPQELRTETVPGSVISYSAFVSLVHWSVYGCGIAATWNHSPW